MHRDEYPCNFLRASQPKYMAAVRGAINERLRTHTESAPGYAIENDDPHCWDNCTDQWANVCPMARWT